MTLQTDVLVVGGGMGGVAAALAAARAGRRVVLTEEYPWLGGQLTSQAVPADEHTWVEEFGVTASYRRLREGIRDYYRDHYPLTEAAKAKKDLNPGAGMVSRICAEPRVAAAVIESMLAPFRSSGAIRVLERTRPVSADVEGDVVRSITVAGVDSGERTTIEADYVLDATELGDLLPLTGTEYVTGFEARSAYGEPSAPAQAQPHNQQAISWCFVIEHVKGDHTIERPADYDHWRSYEPEYWGAPMLSLTAPDPRTLATMSRTFTPDINDDPLNQTADQRQAAGDKELWTFRRIIARDLFEPGVYESDQVLVNWPMIDYLDSPVVDVPDVEHHLAQAKRFALSMFYWLQTEAPRPDGGTGWPGLRLVPQATGTEDGFAQAPYIRESRRIKALRTVIEQDLSVDVRGHARPATFADSVGVGMYRIDLHPSTGGDNYIDVASAPFEIPLGTLVPQRMSNLLAAGKNVGTTHITNGAFRLHPVEWNIGESAGALAAWCLARGTTPHKVAEGEGLAEFQTALEADGVELHWPDGVEGY
ncbi:FAD-dependent oxidoreductase [Ruania rhizosphaerae]|uniref:FAD-dependent oxidoreductase n=1 Tax=Ruania rhizosphaerae TaxID=1840413 RepID=UPI00190F410D|nr:FAD-dependent oxidoreductase [Ruania rhizosphaerae]